MTRPEETLRPSPTPPDHPPESTEESQQQPMSTNPSHQPTPHPSHHSTAEDSTRRDRLATPPLSRSQPNPSLMRQRLPPTNETLNPPPSPPPLTVPQDVHHELHQNHPQIGGVRRTAGEGAFGRPRSATMAGLGHRQSGGLKSHSGGSRLVARQHHQHDQHDQHDLRDDRVGLGGSYRKHRWSDTNDDRQAQFSRLPPQRDVSSHGGRQAQRTAWADEDQQTVDYHPSSVPLAQVSGGGSFGPAANRPGDRRGTPAERPCGDILEYPQGRSGQTNEQAGHSRPPGESYHAGPSLTPRARPQSPRVWERGTAGAPHPLRRSSVLDARSSPWGSLGGAGPRVPRPLPPLPGGRGKGPTLPPQSPSLHPLISTTAS